MVGWPRLREEWGRAFHGVKREIAQFIRTLSLYTSVAVAVGDANSFKEVREQFSECVNVLKLPLGDIWLRDTGPLIGKDKNQQWIGVLPNFNFWGGKFEMEGDTETAEAVCQFLNVKPVSTFYERNGYKLGVGKAEPDNYRRSAFVFENGAFDLNGNGSAILSEAGILNPNRNPELKKECAERWFATFTGATDWIWLDDILENDHTDGHIDNVARFVDVDHVVCQRPSGSDDPNRKVLISIEDKLRRTSLEVTTIPSPGLVLDDEGEPLPASHLNFLISNGVVIFPIYESFFSKRTNEELRQIFPTRDVIGLRANNIIKGGGAFHCMTLEIPKGIMT